MTKEEFHTNIIKKTKQQLIDLNDGVGLHLKHLYDNNNAKSIYSITGIDFSDLFCGKEDTSGIQIKNPKDPFIMTPHINF